MGKILIGTSGYSYSDWKGIFYPQNLPPDKYLSFYADHFPFTELNFSYYRQPDEKQCDHFIRSTPENFLFTIKAHQSLTHLRDKSWMNDAKTFIKGAGPLLKSGRLGAVLLQFPFSFHYSKENRIYLSELCDCLSDTKGGGLPLSLEFRNSQWQRARVWDGMEKRKVCWIITDNPPLAGLPVRELKVTSETAYIRFHGRNSKNWWKGNNVSRYDYRYSPEELGEWVTMVSSLANQVKRLFIAFNNHHKGQAVDNALELTKLLTDNPPPPVLKGK